MRIDKTKPIFKENIEEIEEGQVLSSQVEQSCAKESIIFLKILSWSQWGKDGCSWDNLWRF